MFFPLFGTIATLFFVLFILCTVGAVKALASGRTVGPGHKGALRAAIAYLLATVVLILSLVEFASVSIFVSETNTPITAIYGSGIRLSLTWLNLLFLTALWLLLGWRFLPKGKPRPDTRA